MVRVINFFCPCTLCIAFMISYFMQCHSDLLGKWFLWLDLSVSRLNSGPGHIKGWVFLLTKISKNFGNGNCKLNRSPVEFVWLLDPVDAHQPMLTGVGFLQVGKVEVLGLRHIFRYLHCKWIVFSCFMHYFAISAVLCTFMPITLCPITAFLVLS